ncbi:MAG: response regulator [Verrucomicrobiota bacterium]|nr:response regulator [Verrucomicrobiota bacterium]
MTPNLGNWCQRVLLVDDEPIVLQALKEGLKQGSFETVAVSSCTLALEALQKYEFATIISDYKLPDSTGLQFFEKAKLIQPDSSRILITAYLSLNTLIKSINEGEIFRFLTKPWFLEELLTTTTNAIQRYALVKANKHLIDETSKLNSKLMEVNQQLEARMKDLSRQTVALDRANSDLQTSFDRSLELCYRILNTFEPWLGSHIRRVATLCDNMSTMGPFTEMEKRVLRASGWLCDLGMIGLPRTLLSQYRKAPGSLTPAEMKQVESHVILSQALASFLYNEETVGETIRAHHERFNGTGFPDGLAGDSIPWTARCLAVAVAFSEFNSESESFTTFVLNRSGSSFDPEAVRLVLKVIDKAKLPKEFDQMMVDDLRAGMILASGIYNPNGLLLVAEDQMLTEATIAKIKNYNNLNQINQRLLVYT